jgi:hypothetical protein
MFLSFLRHTIVSVKNVSIVSKREREITLGSVKIVEMQQREREKIILRTITVKVSYKCIYLTRNGMNGVSNSKHCHVFTKENTF